MLDGLALLRGAFVRLDDYRLETAARAILGTGKLFGPEHRAAEIERAWREDPAALAAYNLHDARLVLEILARTGLVELTVRRSLLTGMQLDRVGAQIAAVDSLYLRALRARGRVAPSVRPAEGPAARVTIQGGLVLDSVPGLYRNILVFDFKSLYPSLIRTFNIDPLTHVPPGRMAATPPDRLIRTPSGAAFRRDEPGILPEVVARLAAERARGRAAGDAVGAQATKILMNSLFGVLGASASRLFSPAVANAITTAGQHVIRLAAAAVERAGHRVIYGDTDSLFVDIGEADAGAGRGAGRAAADGHRRRRGRGAGPRVRGGEPPGAGVREGLHALLHARGAEPGDREQEALRRPGGRRGGRAGAGGAGGRAAGLERGRPAVPAGAAGAGLPRPPARRSSSAGSSPTCGPAVTTTSWSTGRRSGSRSPPTPGRRRPTSRRPGSRARRPGGSSPTS